MKHDTQGGDRSRDGWDEQPGARGTSGSCLSSANRGWEHDR